MSHQESSRRSVSELRLVVTADDYDAAVAFYRDVLGMPVSAEFLSEDQGRVVILEAGVATLEIGDRDHVRTIVLNRPEKKNALTHELAWGIVAAVEDAARDDRVRVVALTGSGDAFCAGLDLADAGADASPLSAQGRLLDDVSWVGRFALVLRLVCDKPVVAGLNGVAAGAGLAIAMAADCRLMARSARLIAGYPRIGAPPDGGLTHTLPQAIGYEAAMRFLLENAVVEADEALRLGFVGEVVDDDRFEARLVEYCALLAERAPLAIVTLGESGALAAGSEGIVRVDGVRVDAVDTTGAGDLFSAAYVWADHWDAPLEERLRWAVLYAALSVRVATAVAGAVPLKALLEEGDNHGLTSPVRQPSAAMKEEQ